MQERVIAIIATLDTKGPETAFVRSQIEASGFGTLILDTGILERRNPEGPHPQVSANDIALEGGEDRGDLIARSSEKETRNRGILAMSKGSARILRKLYDEGRISGVIGLGGAQGTEISTYAMRALPLFFQDRKNIHDDEILPLLRQTVPAEDASTWYNALMDYGTMLKREHGNPNQRSVHYTRQSPFEDSNRQVRGRIVKALVAGKALTAARIVQATGLDAERVKKNLMALEREGFIRKKGSSYFI